MENNKYYTPTIEEFHVGFEYEFHRKSYDMSNDQWNWEWNKRNYQTVHFIDKNTGWFDDPCIFDKFKDRVRVKHLDREDIESLGFEFKGKTIDNWYELKGTFNRPLSNYKFRCITLRHDFITHQGIHIVAYEYESKSGEEMTLYLGECKNKSELISQLKRCGIKI